MTANKNNDNKNNNTTNTSDKKLLRQGEKQQAEKAGQQVPKKSALLDESDNEDSAMSLKSHLAVALSICALALLAAYNGFLPANQQVSRHSNIPP